jgi:uncharacterized lipoprotein
MNRKRSMLLRISLLLLLAGVVGCSPKNKLEKCHKPQEFQEAEPGPRIRVPGELEALPSEARLPVPYGETKTEPTKRGEPCLVAPPSFDDRAP